MKSTKILPSLLKEKKWEDIMQFALEEKTKSLFAYWIGSQKKGNKSKFLELIKNIPDKYVPSLIVNFPSLIVPYLIDNYKQSYSEIAKELFNGEMRGNLSILPLLDVKFVKIILENIVPIKTIEEYNNYTYIKFVESNPYNYKDIPLKNLRLMQTYLNINSIIKEICSSFKRKDILKIIKETIEEMCTYMSTLDSSLVMPILSRVSNIINCINKEDISLITKEALKFNYPKIFRNTMYSIFIEGKTSQHNFIENLDKKLVYEEYFLPTVLDEINMKENCQNTLCQAAENMLINQDLKTQKNILILKSFSKIENHPLNKAWKYMINHLKESIIKEIITTGKSENFRVLSNNLNYEQVNFFEIVSLSFDDSMDIITSTIKGVYDKKKEIVSNDPEKYTSIMMYIMTILVSTYNNENKGESLFRSVYTFLDNEICELLIRECIFDPIDNEKYAQWTSNFISTEKLKIIIRTNDIKNIPKYIPKYKCDKFGFIEDIKFIISNDNILTGRISAFELELYESKFWESNSTQVYSDGFNTYRKFVNSLQRSVIQGDKELLEDAYNVNNRYNTFLMIKCDKANDSFRLNTLSQSFSSPLAFIVGQLKTKDYFNEICSKIKEISQIIQSNSVNLPFIVAISLINYCYSEDLKELDTIEMDKFINNVLEICYENASNELDYNYKNINLTSIKELCKNDYKSLVKQYKNCIDNITFKYNSIMIPSDDFPDKIVIPPEAFENAENIMKTPEMTFGRTLPVAVNFFINKIKKLKKMDDYPNFLESLHTFLIEKIEEAKKCINIEIELNPGDITMLCPDFRESYLISLSPSISNIIERLDKRVKYICESDENLINISNILEYDFYDDYEFKNDYNLEFEIILKSKKIQKIEAIKELLEVKKRKEEKTKIYISNIKKLNTTIDNLNKLQLLNIKKVDLSDIDYSYSNEENFYKFNEEFYSKFFDIFFSVDFEPNTLKKNTNSLSSICSIISNYNFDDKYIDKITSVISAILMQTDSIHLICNNLNELIKKGIKKINVKDIIPQIEEICTWGKEKIEKKDKSGALLKTMQNFIEII